MPRMTVGWILILMSDLVFFTAPVVFIVVALGSGMGMNATVDALVAQFQADRSNLLVTSLLALVPMLLLAIVLWIGRRFGKFTNTGPAAALCGSLGIFVVTIYVNASYWPTFLPELRYAGWPHGLELVLGPLFAAPIAMIVGLFIGVLAGKQ